MLQRTVPGVGLVRRAWATPGVAPLGRAARAALGLLPGPAAGHGAPVARGPEVAAGQTGASAPTARRRRAPSSASTAASATACARCTTRRSIRLPQTLTHRAEALHGGDAPTVSTARLLELCMRCGNCEEVCQAGIAHLAAYDEPGRGVRAPPSTTSRQARSLATLRASERYRDGFLAVRPGQYLRRAPGGAARRGPLPRAARRERRRTGGHLSALRGLRPRLPDERDPRVRRDRRAARDDRRP